MAFNLLSGLGLTGSGSFGQTITNPSAWWDNFKNGKTNEVNKDIAEQNLAFQRDNLDYQKALQQQIFNREDTSYQRTVNDMRSAGMSPLAMQGTNGAGEAIATNPLHNDYQHTDVSNMAMLDSAVNAYSTLLDSESKLQQVESQKLDNSLKAVTFADSVAKSGLDLSRMQTELNRSSLDFSRERSAHEYEKTFGFNNSMSPIERSLFGLLNVSGDGVFHASVGNGINSYNKYSRPSASVLKDYSDKLKESLNLLNFSDSVGSVTGSLKNKVEESALGVVGLEKDKDGKVRMTEEARKKTSDSMKNSLFNKIFRFWK